MTTLTLGSSPHTLEVILVQGADFVAVIERDDDSEWATGTEVSLVFSSRNGPPITWTATLEGSTATFYETEDAVADAIVLRPGNVKLWHRLDELDTVWASGKATILR